MEITKRAILGYVFVYLLSLVSLYLIITVLYDIEYSGTIQVQERLLVEAEEKYNDLLTEKERLDRVVSKNRYTDVDDLEETIESLEKQLSEANNTIEVLNSELESIGSKYENDNNSTTPRLLGSSSVYIPSDEEWVSNIIVAADKLNGTAIKAGAKFSLVSKIGLFTAQEYILEGKYVYGMDYFTQALYTAFKESGIDIEDCSMYTDGYLYVDNYTDFIVRNNRNSQLNIVCKFDEGILNIEIRT